MRKDGDVSGFIYWWGLLLSVRSVVYLCLWTVSTPQGKTLRLPVGV